MGYTFENAIADPSEAEIIILVLITIPLCIIATILRLVASKRSHRAFESLVGMISLLSWICSLFLCMRARQLWIVIITKHPV